MEPDTKGNVLDIEISSPFDVKMLQYMITRCALLLRSYKTTLEEDQTLFKQTTVIEDHSRRENLMILHSRIRSVSIIFSLDYARREFWSLLLLTARPN